MDTIKLIVTINDKGGVLELPTGTTAKVRMLKPDKKQVLNDCVVSGNNVLVDITQQMQAVAGEGQCEVILFNSGKTFTTVTFPITIEANVHDDSHIESTDEYATVLNILEKVEGAGEKANLAYEVAAEAQVIIQSAETKLNQFTTDKDTALTQVTNATQSAITAADLANAKAGLANAAASKADTAATNANTATTNANNKIVDVETRFQALTTTQQQDAEVVDARKGKASLRAKIDELDSQLAETAKKTEVNLVNARVDNIIALPDGSTTNDARLEDIKVGANGKTYPTPAVAIREQFSDVNNRFEPVENTVFDISVISASRAYPARIRSTDGKFVITTPGYTAAYAVRSGMRYKITCSGNDFFRIAYFSSLLSGSVNANGLTLIVGNDALSQYEFINNYGDGFIYVNYSSVSSITNQTIVVKEYTESVMRKDAIIPAAQTAFMEKVETTGANLLSLADGLITRPVREDNGMVSETGVLFGFVNIANNKVTVNTNLEDVTSSKKVLLKSGLSLNAGEYTFSLQDSDALRNAEIHVSLYKTVPLNNANKIATVVVKPEDNYKTFVLNENISSLYLVIIIYNTVTVSNVSFYLKIEKGNSMTEWKAPDADIEYWIDKKSHYFIQEISESLKSDKLRGHTKNCMAYTYGWTNPYAIKANNKIFLGYVRKNEQLKSYYVGVTCIDNTGNCENVDLVETNICDDHNAGAVILTNKNKLLFACSTGHGYDNKIHIIRFKKSFQIGCDYDKVVIPVDTTVYPGATTSYAQIIKTDTRIFVIFRVTTDNSTTWQMVYSDDDGLTWTNTMPFYNADKYVMFRQLQSNKNMLVAVIGSHPTHTASNAIFVAYVDLLTGIAYGKDGTTVRSPNIYSGGFMHEELDGADVVVSNNPGYRRRFVNCLPLSVGDCPILYADATDETNTDFKIYRYNNGNATYICNSGRSVYTPSSYIAGGCFKDRDTLYIASNDGNDNWKVSKYQITSDNITEHVINQSDEGVIIRPMVVGNKLIYLSGEYNDGSFNDWSLDVQIEDVN